MSILPLRDEVLARLTRYFQDIPEAHTIEHTLLHYRNGRIDIELLLRARHRRGYPLRPGGWWRVSLRPCAPTVDLVMWTFDFINALGWCVLSKFTR